MKESRKAKADRLTQKTEMEGRRERDQEGQVEHLSKTNELIIIDELKIKHAHFLVRSESDSVGKSGQGRS